MDKSYAIAEKMVPAGSEPSFPIEIILTVVMLILDQCDLTHEQVAERAIRGSLFDRIRFRVIASRQLRSSGLPSEFTNRFFDVVKRERKEDLTAAIVELQNAF